MKESTFRFQPIQAQNALSNELRSVIRDNVLQFYMQGQTQEPQEEGITALYERLSQEDKLEGESNSIANQKKDSGTLLPRSRDYRLSSLRRGRGCNNRTKNNKAQKVPETRRFLSLFT